jgi:proteasome lid subunit RPN8/RPN11
VNEICWVLVGLREGRVWRVAKRRRISGHPTSVEADWAWTLAREEKRGDVMGFWHTHPRGMGTTPSARDVQTMQAWRSALGKPLLCVIADGTQMSGYVFADDESEGRPVQSITRVKREQVIVTVI